MYDLIVIGGGPGGYVAAIRASQVGAKVALVEKKILGGVCLNWGCIPTKSLLESAELYKKMQNSSEMGISCSNLKPDMPTIVSRSRNIVKKLTSGVEYLMKKNGVDVYIGHARIVKRGSVSVDHRERIDAKNIMIATGARNRIPPSITVDGLSIWDCRHAMMAQSIPKSLIVVGGGAIGMEFASFFNAMGSEVTVVEYADTILSYADHDIIKWSASQFQKRGIKIINRASVDKVTSNSSGVTVQIADKRLTAEKCLVATGIIANTEDIGLENVPGVKLDRGHIVVNDRFETGEPSLYAIGDVISRGPWLAHKAMQEGIRCVEGMFIQRHEPLDSNKVPICVYTMPQVAQIGLTESQALKLGREISTATFPLSANGKALAEGNDGIVKVIVEKKTGIFVGAHMAGGHVTELISNYSLLSTLEGLPEDMHLTVFPHPTLSESLQEAVIASVGHGIHI